jgi:hypothetical protein
MATRTERNDGPINEPDYLSLGKDTWTRIWLLTLDHKRIGVMYLTGILASSRCWCAPSCGRRARRSSTPTPTTSCSRCTAR